MEKTTNTLKTLKKNISATVVGVSWKRLHGGQDDLSESDTPNNSPQRNTTETHRRNVRRRSVPSSFTDLTSEVKDGTLNSVTFVRNAFCSMRQKLRSSTRKRKRLVNMSSPYCTPIKENVSPVTGKSIRRRSGRIAGTTPDINDIKMYSPFKIDTPSATPKIKMGMNDTKRQQMKNSPRQFRQDMETVSEALRLLNQNAANVTSAIDKQGSGIITTPGGRRRSEKITRRAVFV